MKIAIYKIFLFFFLLLYSYIGFPQNNTVDSLQKVLQTPKDDTNKVNTLNALSNELQNIGDYKNAMQYARKALSISEKTNFKRGEVSAYNNIGLVYTSQYNYPEALKNLFTALKIAEESGDKSFIVMVNINIAQTYFAMENYHEALKNNYKALKLLEEIGEKEGIAMALTNIGNTYSSQDNNSEALENYVAALKLLEETGENPGIAMAYTNIAAIYFKQGKYAEALKKDSAALKIYEKTENKLGIALTFTQIGWNYEKQGEFALTAGDEATSANKFSEALKNYLASIKIWEKLDNKIGVAQLNIDLGNVNIKLKELSVAKNYLEKGLQVARAINSKLLIKSSYYSLSILDSTQGNHRQAYEHYKMYILYRDSLVNEESTKKFVQEKMQFEFDKKEAVAKVAQDKKDAEAKLVRNLQYFAIGSVLLIAFFLYINNRQKQKGKVKVEKAYSELKSTQAQLIQSEKMASLGELTAGIAHEIQNPLNFVNNFSEVNKELIGELKSEKSKGRSERDDELENQLLGDIEQNLEKINHHGKRADAIVKGMLLHSRTSTGQKEPTDINALADEYLRLAYHGLRAKDKTFNAKLETDFDNSVGKINVIPQDIGRVLVNLINNAFYAASLLSEGGFSESDSKKTPTIWVSTKKVGDKVLVSVRDNGPGIPQKILDKIFQPFFTTKPTGQGTGLGLSLAYDIVKAHGGKIRVETKEGEGAEFIIELQNIINQ